MAIDADQLQNILEASLLVAGKPMSLAQLDVLFEQELDKPTREQIREAIAALQENYQQRGIELVEVASGFRMQARQEFTPWITNLFQERAPRYSRALLETLVLIAYRQPITRGEIEDVRGVAVSTNIIKTLLEREWIRILGHRDVPGRPAILGTTKEFLDYFNLKRIDELPTLSEIKALDQIDPELAKEVALLETESQTESDSAELETTEEGTAEEEKLTDTDSTELTEPQPDPELAQQHNGLDESADGQGNGAETAGDSADDQIDVNTPDTRMMSPQVEPERLH